MSRKVEHEFRHRTRNTAMFHVDICKLQNTNMHHISDMIRDAVDHLDRKAATAPKSDRSFVGLALHKNN